MEIINMIKVPLIYVMFTRSNESILKVNESMIWKKHSCLIVYPIMAKLFQLNSGNAMKAFICNIKF
jgi:hypothetical protein